MYVAVSLREQNQITTSRSHITKQPQIWATNICQNFSECFKQLILKIRFPADLVVSSPQVIKRVLIQIKFGLNFSQAHYKVFRMSQLFHKCRFTQKRVYCIYVWTTSFYSISGWSSAVVSDKNTELKCE